MKVGDKIAITFLDHQRTPIGHEFIMCPDEVLGLDAYICEITGVVRKLTDETVTLTQVTWKYGEKELYEVAWVIIRSTIQKTEVLASQPTF